MRIYLVRHAIAEDSDPEKWPDDALRPLTRDGKERFRDAARGLRRLAPEVGMVISSPYTRARETAAILEKSAGWPAAIFRDELTPGPAPDAVVEMLANETVAAIALVGHEPSLSDLAAYLLTGAASGMAMEFKKGSVASLIADGPAAPGSCSLEWLLPPRALRRLAD